MGIPLPPELRGILGLVGLPWPSTDEAVLLTQAQTWLDLCLQTGREHDNAIEAVTTLTSTNIGQGISAFVRAWADIAGRGGVLSTETALGLSQADACLLIGVAGTQCKLTEITYLVAGAVIVEDAIVLAPATDGASLLAAAQSLRTLEILVKAAIELCVAAIRGLSLMQAQLAPAIRSMITHLESRAIHHGADSTTADAGDISHRLASAPEAPRGTSRRKQNFDSRGEPNSVVARRNQTTGEITAYAEYDEHGFLKKRVDLSPDSAPHNEHGRWIPPPHVHVYKIHVAPDGERWVKMDYTRPANPEEIP